MADEVLERKPQLVQSLAEDVAVADAGELAKALHRAPIAVEDSSVGSQHRGAFVDFVEQHREPPILLVQAPAVGSASPLRERAFRRARPLALLCRLLQEERFYHRVLVELA